jgi:DNA-binding NarL/FixJ family response regulator
MSQMKSTVLLADDHSRLLDRVSQLLFQDFEVVGIVRDGAAAVAAVARLNPDLVVMDISMPVMDGFQAMREIRKLGIDSKIVVLSALDDPEYVAYAFESGSSGFVSKSRMNSDLVFALQEVLAGRTFMLRGEVGLRRPQTVNSSDSL